VVVAERGTAGFVVGDLEDLCGMRANPVCSIRLNDCRVPRKTCWPKKAWA
jgi:butyryl-CoA dehydrogenase